MGLECGGEISYERSMRTDNQRESSNVEDRRGSSKGPLIGGGLGAIVIAIIIALLGGDPSQFLGNLQSGPPAGTEQSIPDTPESREAARFVSVVLGVTEDVWRKVLPEQTRVAYEDPILVLFSGQVSSACGRATAATGPFYCPGDRQVYIDLSFFEELASRFKAPGDFAQAYVIAHEVGHHIQKLLGTSGKVNRLRARLNERDFNQVSVRLELQADFYAGVWAHHAQEMRNILEEGDIEDALRAANAIGDDRLQKQAQGHVVPDSFTHGTSEQRIRWFTKGFKSGDVRQGDTFSIPYDQL
jgi:predicted metalloprotease